MAEYTFALGDVKRSPYLSWVVEAGSEGEAIRLCRDAFANDESVEVSPDDEGCSFEYFILRADPERIGPQNIIDIYDPEPAEPGG